MAQVLVFGASTTWGAWDPEGGWVSKLRRWIDQKNLADAPAFENFQFLVYNLGISGDSTEDLLARFESETEARLDVEEEPTVLVFSIGINDCASLAGGQLRIPPDQFKSNLEKLINLAKKYTSRIVFVGTMPVDESRTSPVPWAPEYTYTQASARQYDEIIKCVCQENKIGFIEIYKKLVEADYQKLLFDGLHPNSDGHQKIFEEVRKYLEENNFLSYD